MHQDDDCDDGDGHVDVDPNVDGIDDDDDDEKDCNDSSGDSDSSSSNDSASDATSTSSDDDDIDQPIDEQDDLLQEFEEFWGEPCVLRADTSGSKSIPGGSASSSSGSGTVAAGSGAAVVSSASDDVDKAFAVPWGHADVIVTIENVGRVSFFEHDQRFEATCFTHDNCKLTRYATPMKNENGNPAQGRAVGLCFAWLCQARPPASMPRDLHNSVKNKRSIPKDLREIGRNLCKECEDGYLLLSKERKLRIDEPEKPDRCP